MRKLSTFQYSDVVKDAPHEKKFSGTITSAPSKGQRSNPMKHADIPVEVKRPLRKKNNKELARLVERAGGVSSPNARKYVAVLEERGVNPNLAKENINMAKVVSNDMFKKAMYTAFALELEKISEFSDPSVQNKATSYGATSAAPIAVGAGIGAGLGGAAGGMMGLASANKAGVSGAAKLGRGIGGLALGLGAGALIGGGLGYSTAKKSKVAPGYDMAASTSVQNKY